MDMEVAKQTQKILQKQGLKFKLNTKVISGDSSGEGVTVDVESVKGDKKETVSNKIHSCKGSSVNEHVDGCGCRPRCHWKTAIYYRTRP